MRRVAIITPILSTIHFSSFLKSQLDAFLTGRLFRLAGRGGLCQPHFRGLPPTPRSSIIRVTKWERCASAEPEVPDLIRELTL